MKRAFFVAFAAVLLMGSYTPGSPIATLSQIPVTAQPIVAAGSYSTTLTINGANVGKHQVVCSPMSDPGPVMAQAWETGPNAVNLTLISLKTVAITTNSVTWTCSLVPVH